MCVITSVPLAAEKEPGMQEARPWYFLQLEPIIRYQVTYYLVNLYYSYCWKRKHLQVLSLWSLLPTLLPCSNQHQHTVKPAQPQLKKSLLTLGLGALIYFPFSPQCHIFLQQIHRQVHFLVMSLISCVKLYKSLMLSEFWFSHEKSEGDSVCFTELLRESRYFYLKSLRWSI